MLKQILDRHWLLKATLNSYAQVFFSNHLGFAILLVLVTFLDINKISYSEFIERKAIVQFNNKSRIVNVRAFSNLELILNEFEHLNNINLIKV